MNKRHVNKIDPTIAFDKDGNVSWTPEHIDYNALLFNQGKVVEHEEFNSLFLQQLYQSNYITDNLTAFFADLGEVIRNKVGSEFELRNSFVKVFTQADWHSNSDGYSYITIPPAEHGYTQDKLVGTVAQKMNIDTEMYVYDSVATPSHFYKVMQINIQNDNTVQLYTDDPTLTGFVIIRPNDKAYRILAENVQGLAKVAKTGEYRDLLNAPDLSAIERNSTIIKDLLTGKQSVRSAEHAATAAVAKKAELSGDSKIQGVTVDEIFEPNTRRVYEAVDAQNIPTTGFIQGQPVRDIFEPVSTVVKKATVANTLIENSRILGIYTLDWFDPKTISARRAILAKQAEDYNTARGSIHTKFEGIDTKIKALQKHAHLLIDFTAGNSQGVTHWLDNTLHLVAGHAYLFEIGYPANDGSDYPGYMFITCRGDIENSFAFPNMGSSTSMHRWNWITADDYDCSILRYVLDYKQYKGTSDFYWTITRADTVLRLTEIHKGDVGESGELTGKYSINNISFIEYPVNVYKVWEIPTIG